MPHKLLLADDSVTIQRVIELTFADEDVQVMAVGDGKQAIVRAQVERPDIVLADVGMPERDGYEVATFIKNTPELAHIPVLLLTGAFEPVDETRARNAGCDGVLVKPFEPQMVIARVKELLAGVRPAWSGSAITPAEQSAGESGVSGTLEDYFDRLDAAFASLDTSDGVVPARPAQAPPPAAAALQAPGPAHEEAPRAPERAPAAAPAEAAVYDPAAPPEAPRAPAEGPEGAPAAGERRAEPTFVLPANGPSLAEAFAALLAAEQQRPLAPSEIRASALADEVIDDIVTRVVQRMSDRAVRDAVLDVAERLVREEIERIKAQR